MLTSYYIKSLRKSSFLSLVVCLTLVVGAFSSVITDSVEASTSRSAIIQEIVGTVMVKKAGGSKSYRAYTNMTLNQGDHLSTESESSVVLKVLDQEDVITIGENADLYISELKEDGGTKTKFTMWGGSMWAKASSLVDEEDEFEIATPTSVMGVRGTNLLVGVDPETGESTFFIASGVGEVSKKVKKGEKKKKNSIFLMPNEQIMIDEGISPEDLEAYTNTVDIDDLVSNISNAIIEAIIKNKAEIDKENEEYIKNQDATGVPQEEIDRINQNLDNIVGNIVNNAIIQGKVNEESIQQLIDEINKDLDKKLDLDNVEPQKLSKEQKAKREKIKKIEMERKKKQEAKKLKQEELKKKNEKLMNKLQEQLEKQIEAKQKAIEDAKEKAAEKFKNKLDDAARAAFEANRDAIAKEKKRQFDAAKSIKDRKKAPLDGQQEDADDDGDDDENTLPPSTEPSATTSTITSSVYGDDVVTPQVLITLEMKNENGDPITDLTVDDIEIKFENEDYVSISELDIIHDFTLTDTDNGIYTFIINSEVGFVGSLNLSLLGEFDPSPFVKKASIRVKDIIVIEDLYIIFSQTEIVDAELSSIEVEVDAYGQAHFTMIIKNIDDNGIDSVTSNEISMVNHENEMINVNFSDEELFGSLQMDFQQNNLLYKVIYSPGTDVSGIFDIYVRGKLIESIDLQIDYQPNLIVPVIDEGITYTYPKSAVDVVMKRVEMNQHEMTSYTEVTIADMPDDAAKYVIRGASEDYSLLKQSEIQLEMDDTTYPSDQMTAVVGHTEESDDNYIIVIFYDADDRAIGYYINKGPTHPDLEYVYAEEDIDAEEPVKNKTNLYASFACECYQMKIELYIRNLDYNVIQDVYLEQVTFEIDGTPVSNESLTNFEFIDSGQGDGYYIVDYDPEISTSHPLDVYVRGVFIGQLHINYTEVSTHYYYDFEPGVYNPMIFDIQEGTTLMSFELKLDSETNIEASDLTVTNDTYGLGEVFISSVDSTWYNKEYIIDVYYDEGEVFNGLEYTLEVKMPQGETETFEFTLNQLEGEVHYIYVNQYLRAYFLYNIDENTAEVSHNGISVESFIISEDVGGSGPYVLEINNGVNFNIGGTNVLKVNGVSYYYYISSNA